MALSLINPRNQGGLRYIFDLVDPQSNPETIDMTAIQPVVDFNFGGFVKLNDYENLEGCTEAGSSIAGVQTKTWRILSYGNAVGVTQQVVVPVGYNAVIWGIKQHLLYDAAGAAAVNGKYASSEILMTCPNGVQITKYHGCGQQFTGTQLYAPGNHYFEPLTRTNICVVPAGCVLDLVWWLQDGTNFPANTVVVYAVTAQCFPVGAPLPIGI